MFGSIEPVVLESPAQSGFFFPQLLGNGDLAMTSRSARGDDDLFIARARPGGGFERPEALSGDFNSDHDDWDLVEDRSATVRVWASARPGGAGKTDIYMSRRTTRGQWSEARNVVAANSPALETAPRLTPDGQVLFFQRRVNGGSGSRDANSAYRFRGCRRRSARFRALGIHRGPNSRR